MAYSFATSGGFFDGKQGSIYDTCPPKAGVDEGDPKLPNPAAGFACRACFEIGQGLVRHVGENMTCKLACLGSAQVYKGNGGNAQTFEKASKGDLGFHSIWPARVTQGFR